jgi:hypothetical protein
MRGDDDGNDEGTNHPVSMIATGINEQQPEYASIIQLTWETRGH